MEEIKFRLHDNCGVVIGYEEHLKNEHGCYQIHQKSLRGDFENIQNVREGYFIASNYKCQFTGLKDKNGKEIYEGDVLSKNINNKIFKRIVTFLEGCFMTIEKWDNGISDEINWLHASTHFEIIGNIHENPELL